MEPLDRACSKPFLVEFFDGFTGSGFTACGKVNLCTVASELENGVEADARAIYRCQYGCLLEYGNVKTDFPPVTNATLPERSGMSVAGLYLGDININILVVAVSRWIER